MEMDNVAPVGYMGKFERKRPLGRSRHRWEEKVKMYPGNMAGGELDLCGSG
jgi:hypothetical protein